MNYSSKSNLFKNSCLFIILVLVFELIFTSCNPSQFSSANTQIPQLILSILSDVKTFNYVLNSESPNIFSLTYEGLVNQNPITGKIEPALAESWQVSDDKLSIIFSLRKDLKWSDGQPLTADDVVFTYKDLYLNEAIPTDIKDILRIGKSRKLPTVKKLDERRVQFNIPEPFRPFLLSTSAPILPAHALKESVQKKALNGSPTFLSKWGVDTPPEQIIINGPYKLERYNTSQRVIFRRNPYYWRKDPYGESQPYIERIIWQIVESTDTALLQFRSGGLDAVSVTPDYFSLLKKQERQGKYRIYNGGLNPGTTFLSFNLNKGKRDGKPLVDPIKSRWFNSVEFRQAVAYAIDRERMINNVFRGLGEPQNSPISVQSPFYLSPQEGLKTYDYNPQEAKRLLLKAGFKFNAKGQLLDAEGNRVRFTLLTNSGNKIREAMGSQIKQDLSLIGIQVDFTPLAWGTYTDKLSNSLEWEASLLGLTGGLEPNDGANIWSPEGGGHMFNQKPQVGQQPIQGWEVAPWEAEIGKLYIQAAQELDEAKVKAIYAKTQQLAQENLPFIYLVNSYSMLAVRNRLEGVKFSALANPFWNIYEVKLTS